MAKKFGRKVLPDAVKQALERAPGSKFRWRLVSPAEWKKRTLPRPGPYEHGEVIDNSGRLAVLLYLDAR